MARVSSWRTITTVFTVATIVYAIRTRHPAGTFLKVPCDFRMPTVQRLRERFWNPQDPRIFTPHYFGVGWSLNAYHVVKWLRGAGGDDGGEGALQEPER